MRATPSTLSSLVFSLALLLSAGLPAACSLTTGEEIDGTGGATETVTDSETSEDQESSEDPESSEMTELTPCEEAYGSDCGANCDDDDSCAKGLYCHSGKCTADCIKDADCSSRDCLSDGRCADNSNIQVDPLETDPEEDEPDDAPTCVEGEVEFEAIVPQVWLLLDQSGSMSSNLGDVSRWEALGSVLLGDPNDAEDRGVVGDFEDRVAFGATFYTSGASSSSSCVLALESVALAGNSYSAIRHRYNQLAPSGGTPTAESIAAVVSVASTSDLTGGPKLLVLATDGAPGVCAPHSGEATTEVENEVEAAFATGIQTFAISIDDGTDSVHMQRVANLGVGLPADAEDPAPFYTADSQEQLKLAFSTILDDVPRSCVFSLNGEVDRDNAGEGTVTLAGEELSYQADGGWRLKQADQVELVGDACDQIQAGEEDLDITFPCSVFTPVVK